MYLPSIIISFFCLLVCVHECRDFINDAIRDKLSHGSISSLNFEDILSDSKYEVLKQVSC